MKINRINQREIERYILGELPERRLKKIEEFLKENKESQEEIKKIKDSNKKILTMYPSDRIVEKIFSGLGKEKNKQKKKIKSRPVFVRRLLYVSPLFVLAILVVFLNLDLFKHETDKPDIKDLDQTTRSKGLSHAYLTVFKSGQGKIKQLKNQGRAKAGDTLQLFYSSPKESYGVIFSIDGRGGVTLHYPYGIEQSTALKLKKKVKLPSGFLLDDAPDFERFFFITSNLEIDVARILGKAKNQAKNLSQIEKGNVTIDKNLRQYSIIIKKGERP